MPTGKDVFLSRVDAGMMRWLPVLLVMSCAASKESHRSSAEITLNWLYREVIDKGQPVRISYLRGERTLERAGHLIRGNSDSVIIFQYQDLTEGKMVSEDFSVNSIRDIWLVGDSDYDNKRRSRWIKIIGFGTAGLIYLTIYFSN